MQHPSQRHIPVLLEGNQGVMGILQPREGERVLDATLGLGGHAEAFLRAIGPTGHLSACDADEENLDAARERLAAFEQQCTFIHGNFRDISSFGLPLLDIIFADLGLSSPHIDDPARGFTFRTDAPLDLRFDRAHGAAASALIHGALEEELTRMFRDFGELRESKRLASALYRHIRHGGRMQTTGDLKSVVERTAGYRAPDILPRVFQALRIAVNDEMGSLQDFLAAAPSLLRAGGRLGIISYHSLEDRMVKREFRRLTTPIPDPMTGGILVEAPFTLLTRKAVVPSGEETEANPRARSARFRAILRRA